jgi:hypothetical protein
MAGPTRESASPHQFAGLAQHGAEAGAIGYRCGRRAERASCEKAHEKAVPELRCLICTGAASHLPPPRKGAHAFSVFRCCAALSPTSQQLSRTKMAIGSSRLAARGRSALGGPSLRVDFVDCAPMATNVCAISNTSRRNLHANESGVRAGTGSRSSLQAIGRQIGDPPWRDLLKDLRDGRIRFAAVTATRAPASRCAGHFRDIGRSPPPKAAHERNQHRHSLECHAAIIADSRLTAC